jgi:hypothetical protein
LPSATWKILKRVLILAGLVALVLLLLGDDFATIDTEELRAGLAAIGAWTVVSIGVGVALFRLAAERSHLVGKYLPEPPEDVAPAIAYGLATEGHYSPRVLTATLLDLIDRGYYDARASNDSSLDLVLSIPPERPRGRTPPHEGGTLRFFDDLLRAGPASLVEMRKRVPQTGRSADRWKAIHASLSQAGIEEVRWDRDLILARWLAAGVGAAGYLAFLALFNWADGLVTVALPLGLVAVGSFFLVPDIYLKRQEERSRQRQKEWQAFARWTRDFPNLRDDHPATLKLWSRVLVYAAAFGTAERIVETADIPLPFSGQSADRLAYIFDAANFLDLFSVTLEIGESLGVGLEGLEALIEIGGGIFELAADIAGGI